MTLVVANSVEQAREQMLLAAPAELPGARIISTHQPDLDGLRGATPLAHEIILTEGWNLGRHAHRVEAAKRGGDFSDARVVINGAGRAPATRPRPRALSA